MTSVLAKIRKACQEKRLGPALYARAKPYLYGLRYLISNPAGQRIRLHCPEYTEPSTDPAEQKIVRRIFDSFRKMKEDQRKADACYLPSSMWQQQIDRSFSGLTEGLASGDTRPFHFFLANFGTWKSYHGIESNVLIRENMGSLIRRRYLANVVFNYQLKIWEWFYNRRKGVDALHYPPHGNQSGAFIDNVFVGPGSFFNEIYGSILRELVSREERPVVADLGAGYGKLAYFTLRDQPRFTFLDFDLPETLCLAAYYLMKVWPDKKVLLYGEEEYSPAAHSRYDLIFMPSFEIAKLGSNSVDLFINKNSLGEMTRESAANYVGHITRAARYFFHMNHDILANTYTDHSRGLLGHEYPVPADTFKLLFRYPDVSHMLFQGGVDYRMDIFMYLYERRTPVAAAQSSKRAVLEDSRV